MRALFAHLFRGQNEVLGILVVFLHSGGDRQDVQVEDDILWQEVNRHQQVVGANTDAHFVLKRGRLTCLVEGHDNDCSSIVFDLSRFFQEVFLTLFE